jgi:hypothetical protein
MQIWRWVMWKLHYGTIPFKNCWDKCVFKYTFIGTVPVHNQLEVFAYVPRCRRGRRGRYCYRPRVVRLFYRYEFWNVTKSVVFFNILCNFNIAHWTLIRTISYPRRHAYILRTIVLSIILYLPSNKNIVLLMIITFKQSMKE